MIKKYYYKILEYINISWLFLIIVICFSIIILVFNPNRFADFINSFINIFKQISLVLLIVFIIIFLINLLVDNKKIIKYLGQKSGVIGWIMAIISGIVSTGPIYAWYPMLEDLQDKKMRSGLICTFLYNRAIKIPLMPLFISYFGLPILIVMTILMIVFSIINGLILELIIGKNYNPRKE